MIQFGELEVEGFCSIHRLKIDLNKRGLNVLQAKNGSGKTTIFSAFSWALFGQTLKSKNKVQTYENLRKSGYRGTKVSIKFTKGEINYEVIRCDGYKRKVLGAKGKKRLILIQDGSERTDLRDKRQVQEEIERVLGFSHNLFINSVIFGQKLKRIIQETGPNKKKVFDDAFEVTYLNDARKKANDSRKTWSEKINSLQPKYASLKTKITSLYGELSKAKKAKKEFENNKEKEIAQISSKISNTRDIRKKLKHSEILFSRSFSKAKLKEAESKLLNHKENVKILAEKRKLFENQIFKDELQLDIAQGKGISITRDIEKLKEAYPALSAPCRVCGAKMSKEKVIAQKKEIAQDILKLENEYKGVVDKISEIRKRIKSNNSGLASIKDITGDESILENKVNELRELKNKSENNVKLYKLHSERLLEYEEQLKALKDSKFTIKLKPIRKEIEKALTEFHPLEKEIKELEKQVENFDWLMKVPLSNSGIKAFIFDYMMKLVNEELRAYSKIIGFKVNFGLKMDTAKRDFYSSITRDGIERPYEDLSGGEQQLVDVAIAFAIHDTVSIDKATNVLVMDEVFESLDNDNIEIVTEMIQEKARVKAVWLITHLTNFSSSNCHIINLENQGGFTKLIEA